MRELLLTETALTEQCRQLRCTQFTLHTGQTPCLIITLPTWCIDVSQDWMCFKLNLAIFSVCLNLPLQHTYAHCGWRSCYTQYDYSISHSLWCGCKDQEPDVTLPQNFSPLCHSMSFGMPSQYLTWITEIQVLSYSVYMVLNCAWPIWPKSLFCF